MIRHLIDDRKIDGGLRFETALRKTCERRISQVVSSVVHCNPLHRIHCIERRPSSAGHRVQAWMHTGDSLKKTFCIRRLVRKIETEDSFSDRRQPIRTMTGLECHPFQYQPIKGDQGRGPKCNQNARHQKSALTDGVAAAGFDDRGARVRLAGCVPAAFPC